jgi:protein transport protein SEC31
MPIVDTFNTINQQIAQLQLNAGEKRQFKEIETSSTLMSDKLNNQEIDPVTCQAMLDMIGVLNVGDFNAASQIHIGLTQTAWNEHKDWLKGVKFLIQLCKTKFGQR